MRGDVGFSSCMTFLRPAVPSVVGASQAATTAPSGKVLPESYAARLTGLSWLTAEV